MSVLNLNLADLRHSTGDLAIRENGKSDDGIKALAANIERFGQLVPLVVTKKNGADHYVVVDGNRRLAAMKLLKWMPRVVCILHEKSGIGDALSANVMRRAMNPMDEFDAFAKMVKAGMSAADIAKAFGRSAREVDQVLALASLAPSIKEKVRAGKVTWAVAKELTTVADHATQEKLLKRCGGNSDYMIRRAIREQAPGESAALFDVKDYVAAGGTFHTDLFGGRDHDESASERLFADADLFLKLQQGALAKKLEALKAEGWKDVRKLGKQPPNYYRWPFVAHMKKADRANHILLYTDDSWGGIKLADHAEPDQEAVRKARKAEKPSKKPKAGAPASFAGDGVRAFPAALTADIAHHRGLQVKEAIVAGKAKLGLRSLMFSLIRAERGTDHWGYSSSIGTLGWKDSGVDEAESTGMKRYAAIEAEFSKLAKLSDAQLWDALAKPKWSALIPELLGYVCAAIFDGQHHNSRGLGDVILAEHPVDGRKTFVPDEAFWLRTTRGYMLAQLAKVIGSTKAVEKLKAKDLAKAMGTWFTAPEAVTYHAIGLTQGGKIGPALIAKFKAWVPDELALPTAKEAKKGLAVKAPGRERE